MSKLQTPSISKTKKPGFSFIQIQKGALLHYLNQNKKKQYMKNEVPASISIKRFFGKEILVDNRESVFFSEISFFL